MVSVKTKAANRDYIWSQIRTALSKLEEDDDVSIELIAHETGVSYNALQNWKVKRKLPGAANFMRFKQVCASHGVKL